ncbi:MAG: bifunctional phosphopantothenoylcysteine decarboxylase/phosphopantothenate--cysteine ligase CoaBC [Vampirovibrionales bacterium]|nr:bifunctional phosphopantothenoylcysteine decarboxylase/phosphopantothenate--cysteine ligase CoaBC [Vampirovibrionales bacterium]
MMTSGFMFHGKTIALGVTGGVAAYRAADLTRELYRRGAKRVVALMTPAAEKFLAPLTLEALTREPVHREALAMDAHGTPQHIALAQSADALLIHPATANTIAKLAHGMADDAVTTAAIAFTGKPLLIAPAMNTRMWLNPMVVRNLDTLRKVAGATVIEPTNGLLACGETGDGHLAQMETVLQWLYRSLHPERDSYAGVRALVTAGGTAESIDGVRLLSNRSSGKMGVAMADELFAMGADVTLVATTSTSSGLNLADRPYQVIFVDSAAAMAKRLQELWPSQHLLAMAAAIADFRAQATSPAKLRRVSTLTLELESTPDILAMLAARKKPGQVMVGFAAESGDLPQKMREKLVRKGVDAIIGNDVSRADIAFDSDDNEVTLLFANGESQFFPKAPKPQIARQALMRLRQRFWPDLPLDEALLEQVARGIGCTL